MGSTVSRPARANTATLGSRELYALLADVSLVAAPDQSSYPPLRGVLLHTAVHDGQPVLVASATDRFMLVQAHAPLLAGGLAGRLWLTNQQVRQTRAMLRPFTARRVDQAQVEIAIAAGTCQVRQLAHQELAGMALSFPAQSGEFFPDPAALADHPRQASDGPVLVNPALLARAAKLCRRGEELSVELTGPSSPLRIAVGTRLWGLVMPMRPTGAKAPAPPVFSPPIPDTAGRAA